MPRFLIRDFGNLNIPNGKRFLNLHVGIIKNSAFLLITQLLILTSANFSKIYLQGIGPIPLYLASAILAVSITRISGRTFGLLSTLFSTVSIAYFSVPRENLSNWELAALSPVLIFLAASMAMVLLVQNNKTFEEIKKTKEREKELLRLISLQGEQYVKSEEEIKARDEFLSIASHEFKNLLTTILLQLQQTTHDIKTVSLVDFSFQNLLKRLENVKEQAWELSKMTNDLLNVSLIITGRFKMEPEELEITALLRHKIDQFSQKSHKSEIMFHSDQEIEGKWDKIRLEQVITNLLTNAIKYGSGKPIEVKAEKTNSKAVISIRDQGVGIPKDQQKTIFEKFQRSATAKNFEGLGIGLYISNQIIRAQQGSIKVKSKPGKGSVFIVKLPLKPSLQALSE